MMKKVIVSGAVGGIVLLLWTFVVNGLLGFRSRIDLNRLPEERRVYDLLKETVTEPGRYTVNPEAVPAEGYPVGEPVFSVDYAGFGHEAAGRLALLRLGIAFLTTILAAAMLSIASERVLNSYPRKVLFFGCIGLLFALFADLPAYEIGGHPLADALLLATNSIASWTAVGLVVAWLMKPA